MVNRILNKGLHTEGDDCMAYTTNLMDKLERVKQEHPDDTIHDEVAAKAYIEQFALETFDRADNAVSANKASAFVDALFSIRVGTASLTGLQTNR